MLFIFSEEVATNPAHLSDNEIKEEFNEGYFYNLSFFTYIFYLVILKIVYFRNGRTVLGRC